ncbi:AAA family ATPase [Paracoccus sp. MC1854]|nr:AAA family ATPase [Paracoccus sp. MC1854]
MALHRAVGLASQDPEARVLLATFNTGLAQGLSGKLDGLATGGTDVRARITVDTLGSVAKRLAADVLGYVAIASGSEVEALLDETARTTKTSVDQDFLKDEWRLIVDAWDVRDGDIYRDLPRLGWKIRMATSRRDELWTIFERVRRALQAQEKETEAGLMHRLCHEMTQAPFTHVIFDEAQDISVPELHLLAAIAGDRPNGLFFAGDIRQRIFRSAFPWKAAGVDVQGRSRSLKVNYRTFHQNRTKSDLLLPPRLLEADGGEDSRLGVSSIFHGPLPRIQIFDSPAGNPPISNGVHS